MRFKFFLTVLIDNIKFEIELNNKKTKKISTTFIPSHFCITL